MDAELWAQWEAGWRQMEATARRRGWEVTPLAISRPASAASLRRLEAAAGQPVPPQLRAVLQRAARVTFGWHVPSHLRGMERDDLPTGSANGGAIWDLAHIEQAVTSYPDWRHTLAEENPAGSAAPWDRLFPFYVLPNGDLLAIDAVADGPQPVRYVDHEQDMLHGTALAPDFFGFVTEMSKLGFAGTEWASWLRFGVREGETFHLRADSPGGQGWLSWLERDPARPASDEPPPVVPERTAADRALLSAARAGNRDAVEAALRGGAMPDATWSDEGRMELSLWSDEYATALTYAVRRGDGPMLDLLVEHGAMLDTRRLATGDAVEAAPPEMLTRLLRRGARVNGWKGDRNWPLHLLVERRAQAVAPTLEEYRARLSAEESEWGALLAAAGIVGIQQERLAGYLTPDAYLAMLEALLAAGADPDAPWDNGMTMLMRGDAATMRVLLRYGADVHARSRFGDTALHDARSPEIAQLLVEHGADVNAPSIPVGEDADEHGRTPLHTALLVAGRRGLEMCRALIALGADPLRRDSKGRNSLFYCTRVDSLLLLEPYGLDPLECLDDGTTLLHSLLRMMGVRAAFSDEVAVLDHLLAFGLDINATDAAGQTMLHIAAERMENPADIQLLLDRKADRAIRDNKGKRPKDLVRRSLRDMRALL